MEITATAKSVRVSPRKIRLIASAIRDMSVDSALTNLHIAHKRAADVLEKTLKSAVSNAVNNAKLAKENLVIESILVTEGGALKRFHPSTRGRIHPYKRRSSHVTVILKERRLNK